MKRRLKKGFTLVELLVVIAILAILATVSVVGYSSFTKKANLSNDNTVIAELNRFVDAYKSLDTEIYTVTDAQEALDESGFDLSKIKTSSKGYHYAYDIVADEFSLLDDSFNLVEGYSVPSNVSVNLFAFVTSESERLEAEAKGYSTYLQATFDGTTLTNNVTKGIDTGKVTDINTINYVNSNIQDVIIHANCDALNIYAPNDDVYVSGIADTLTILDAAPSSIHIGESFIKSLVMEDSDGHVEVESGAIISRLIANTGDIDIESGSSISYLEANAGNVSVADATCVTKYYAESGTIISGVNEESKVSAKVAETTCTTHTEATKEVSGNKVTYCSVCGNIISIEYASSSSSDDSGNTKKHPSSITVSGDSTVNVGATITLTATVSPSDADILDVTWTSTDTNIATVDENGVVTGVADGDATITAASKDPSTPGVAYSKIITVIDANKPTPTGITITGTDSSVVIGSTIQLTATVSPSDASTNVGWTSSNTNVATVDAKTGEVMGVSAGNVTITATSKVANTIYGTYEVKVNKPDPTSVTINYTSTSVIVGGSLNLSANVSPSAAEQSVTWSSENASYATVADGVVTGVATGTVKIIATSTINSEIKGELSITVVASPTGITISGDTNVEVGSNITLTATVEPDGTVQTVTWSSSDTSIATIDTNGKVTGVKAGTATITATTVNSKFDTKEITVTAPDPTSISISGDSSIVVGNSITLTATVLPNGADQGVTWTSSDSSVASIDNDGKVTTIKAGTVTITATSNAKGTITGTRNITVSNVAVNATSLGGEKKYQVGTEELTVYEGGSSGNIKYYSLKAPTYSYNNYRYVVYDFEISANFVYIDLNGQTIIENDACNSDSNDRFFVDITGSHVTITNGTIITSSNGIKVEGQDVTIDCNVISNVKLSFTKDDNDFYTLTNSTFTEPKEDYTSTAYAVYVEYGGEEEITSAKITGGSYKVNMNNNQEYTFNSGNGDTYTGCYSACVREYASLTITGGTFSNPIITRGTGQSCDNSYINKIATLTVNGGDFGTGTNVYLGTNTDGKATISQTNYYHGSNINNIFTVNNSIALGVETGRSVYTLSGSGSNITYSIIYPNT